VPDQTDFFILRKSSNKDLWEGRGFNRDLIRFEVKTVLACIQFGPLAVRTHGFSQLKLRYLITVLVMQKNISRTGDTVLKEISNRLYIILVQ